MIIHAHFTRHAIKHKLFVSNLHRKKIVKARQFQFQFLLLRFHDIFLNKITIYRKDTSKKATCCDNKAAYISAFP